MLCLRDRPCTWEKERVLLCAALKYGIWKQSPRLSIQLAPSGSSSKFKIQSLLGISFSVEIETWRVYVGPGVQYALIRGAVMQYE